VQANKIDAIYALREAAETKAVAEVLVDAEPSPESRDMLLNAQLDLESKTQQAIEACHECGEAHAADAPHRNTTGNVVQVDFTGNA
jgi:hypothetical protein